MMKNCQILNDYFANITAGLEIAEIGKNLTKIKKSCDPVDVAIDTYKSINIKYKV